MFLDHPTITATNSITEPDRIERLTRVYGYVDGAGRRRRATARFVEKFTQLHDHKGTLIVFWNEAPTTPSASTSRAPGPARSATAAATSNTNSEPRLRWTSPRWCSRSRWATWRCARRCSSSNTAPRKSPSLSTWAIVAPVPGGGLAAAVLPRQRRGARPGLDPARLRAAVRRRRAGSGRLWEAAGRAHWRRVIYPLLAAGDRRLPGLLRRSTRSGLRVVASSLILGAFYLSGAAALATRLAQRHHAAPLPGGRAGRCWRCWWPRAASWC